MNEVILMGRLTRNPEIRYSAGAEQMCIAKYTLAVDRAYKKEGEQAADFISCVAFKSKGEFAEKYLKKGSKILVTGSIQTGSYVNKDGVKVYTTDVIINSQEFAESKKDGEQSSPAVDDNGFSNIPDGLEEELPFN